jgi:hypothetical protein
VEPGLRVWTGDMGYTRSGTWVTLGDALAYP